jgi:hypothetical protein
LNLPLAALNSPAATLHDLDHWNIDMPGKIPVNIGLLVIAILAGCTPDRGDIGLGGQCADGLDAGYRELNHAEANGFSGTVAWSKAATLLAAAKIQQQFEEYQNCVLKVRKARGYLSGS